jgi:aldehyde dehydrogenase (NAD+)
MEESLSFYIGGEWVRPVGRPALDVINTATEKVFSRIALGTAEA